VAAVACGLSYLARLSCFAWLLVAGSARAQASGAGELVREAHAREATGEDEVALRLYTDALTLDPTCGEGYLGLGALRMRLGDAREAERVFSVSLAHVPALNGAYLGRARARRAIGRAPEAAADLETYANKEDDPRALRELARWYGEDHRPLAELATWRRVLTLTTGVAKGEALTSGVAKGEAPTSGVAKGEPLLATEARTMIRALQIVVQPADPVTSSGASGGGSIDRDPVRAAIARIARRGG